MKTEERVKLTPEQLDAIMAEGEQVHTFMQSKCGILLGADWDRSEILKAATQRGAELSGKAATKAKHGAVVWHEDGTPVFVETKQP